MILVHKMRTHVPRAGIRFLIKKASQWRTKLYLARLWIRMHAETLGSPVRFLNYTCRLNDGPNFYLLYKDVFVNRIYHFEAVRSDPMILDCGSNIGMTILYFKHVYPQARIVGFEPDPRVFPLLQENMDRNHLKDVKLMPAAVAGKEGSLRFFSDGKYGSCLSEHLTGVPPEGWSEHQVPSIRLRDYLKDPVDFLKMNIEGAEWEVLADSEDRLGQVREMVIEYHHQPGLPRTLHKILELLHRQGFEYLINDFDSETNIGSCPPFHLGPESRYYLLVYARRNDGTGRISADYGYDGK